MDMQVKRFYLVALGVITVLLLGIFAMQLKNKQFVAPQNELISQEKPQATKQAAINLNHACQSGKTAFDALLVNAQDVKFEESSFGKFITSINGVAQSSGKYWLYKIDGKEATVSADNYTCEDKEQIEWELK